MDVDYLRDKGVTEVLEQWLLRAAQDKPDDVLVHLASWTLSQMKPASVERLLSSHVTNHSVSDRFRTSLRVLGVDVPEDQPEDHSGVHVSKDKFGMPPSQLAPSRPLDPAFLTEETVAHEPPAVTIPWLRELKVRRPDDFPANIIDPLIERTEQKVAEMRRTWESEANPSPEDLKRKQELEEKEVKKIETSTDMIKSLQKVKTHLEALEKEHQRFVASAQYALETLRSPTPIVPDEFVRALYVYTVELRVDGVAPDEEAPSHSQQIYRMMNTAMREGNKEMLSLFRPFIRVLNKALSNLPSPQGVADRPILLFRGLNCRIDVPPVGHVLNWIQFSSTTVEPGVAKEFLSGGDAIPTLFMIRPCAHVGGKNVAPFSALPKERELLVPPNVCLEVESYVAATEALACDLVAVRCLPEWRVRSVAHCQWRPDGGEKGRRPLIMVLSLLAVGDMILVGTQDGPILRYDLKQPTDELRSIDFGDDGVSPLVKHTNDIKRLIAWGDHVLACSWDNTVSLWRAKDCLSKAVPPPDAAGSIALASHIRGVDVCEQFAVVVEDSALVSILRKTSEGSPEVASSFRGGGNILKCVKFLRLNVGDELQLFVLVGGEDKCLRLFRIHPETGVLLDVHGTESVKAEVCECGTDRSTPPLVTEVPKAHERPINELVTIFESPTLVSIASSCGKGVIKVWNISSSNMEPPTIVQKTSWKASEASVPALTVWCDHLCTGSQDGNILVWPIDTILLSDDKHPPKSVATLAGKDSIACLFSRDGTLASGSFKDGMRLWDIRDLPINGREDLAKSFSLSKA